MSSGSTDRRSGCRSSRSRFWRCCWSGRGETVTRDDIRNRLWSADTFVDFDHGLNKAINKIRDTLGDSAASPRFIETVARRGYRFIADVTVVTALSAEKLEASTGDSRPG